MLSTDRFLQIFIAVMPGGPYSHELFPPQGTRVPPFAK